MLKKTMRYVAVTLFLILGLGSVSPVQARFYHNNLQPRPDSWYLFKSVVDSKSLPVGVIVEDNTLINTTSDPLIIESSIHDRWMLKSNQMFTEQEKGKGFTVLAQSKGFELVSKDGKSLGYGLMLDRAPVETVEIYRPENVAVPPPAKFAIFSAEYKNQPLKITGTIEYILNPDFNPYKLNDEINKNRRQQLPILIIAIGLPLLIGFFVMKRFHLRNGVRSNN